MDFLIPFQHVHADEMDSSPMATVSDDLSCPVHAGSVVDSFGVKPSLGQYTDEMVLSFFVQTVQLINLLNIVTLFSAEDGPRGFSPATK
jgi:hypothetical protein